MIGEEQFGKEIPITDVCSAAYDGKRVAVFCINRGNINVAMRIMENRINYKEGCENFMVDYVGKCILYNKGAIVFVLKDGNHLRNPEYKTDCHYIMRSKP